MMYTSAHTMEHAMGSFHDKLVHGAGLIEIAHAYYDFFAERKASEENMIKMAIAMGVTNPTSGKDFITALDKLIVILCETGQEKLRKYILKYPELKNTEMAEKEPQ